MSRRTGMLLHARRRVEERYGKALTRSDLRSIARKIRKSRGNCADAGAFFVKTVGRDSEMYDVPYDGHVYRVVYRVSRRMVVTAYDRVV